MGVLLVGGRQSCDRSVVVLDEGCCVGSDIVWMIFSASVGNKKVVTALLAASNFHFSILRREQLSSATSTTHAKLRGCSYGSDRKYCKIAKIVRSAGSGITIAAGVLVRHR